MADHPVPRLKVRYREELLPRLQAERGLANPMQVPRISKVIVNVGIGESISHPLQHAGAAVDSNNHDVP